jgi:integrase
MPLARAEIQWGLHIHAQDKRHTDWPVTSIQLLANWCRINRVTSLADVDVEAPGRLPVLIGRYIRDGLSVAYFDEQEAKAAGYIETHYYGRVFEHSASRIDLTKVTVRWLRDLLWDHYAELLRSAKCPRSRTPIDAARQACMELSAFLAIDAPAGGQDPRLLGKEHIDRFVADQRHREREGLVSLSMRRSNGKPSTVTTITRRLTFNNARKVLYTAWEAGRTAEIGLDPAFITAMPYGGTDFKPSRNPFSDEVARALADEANLRKLAEFDPYDRGVRDVWEAIVVTGRRSSEVLKLRLQCIGRYSGLPLLWHDQTKVGNLNAGIRIPEPLYQRLDERRAKTITRFEHRFGRLPTADERAEIALFPATSRNPYEKESLSYQFWSTSFRDWVDGLDLGPCVAHQARHTLATRLLRHGASLAHIRKYLGQVSDRMAEHYAKVADTDLDEILQAVWVAGPGAPNPGELLGSPAQPLDRHEAMALALDLSRRSTPAYGGFCTFQPVVDGGACPWNVDCENCDKFVMSGADLLYWRRKAEQWRSIAERAPDDATADYLHKVFEPTARAIEGLEKALAGLGLLHEALDLDLRRPQNYFHRLWSTGFLASDLAQAANDAPGAPILEQAAS